MPIIIFKRTKISNKKLSAGAIKKPRLFWDAVFAVYFLSYIMPISPPCGIAGAGGSLMSATTPSVVRNVLATLVAF